MNPLEHARSSELEDGYWWFVGMRSCLEAILGTSGGGGLGRWLDLGCGTGGNLAHWQKNAHEAWGLDLSEEALGFCRARGLRNLVCGDAHSLPFPAESFDTVSAIGLIEHLEDDLAFLRECRRILRPGGRMLLLTSAHAWLWSEHDTANFHRRRYSIRGLERLAHDAGFRPSRLSYANCFLFPALAAGMLLSPPPPDGASAKRLLPKVPGWINRSLTDILHAEASALKGGNLPWGISLIGVFRPSEDGAPPVG